MLTTRINDAIRDCVERCRGQESPLACLVLHLDELRQAGWSDFDLRVVETAVVRLLTLILEPPAIGPPECPECKWPRPVVLLREAVETVYRCSECQYQWPEATA